MKRNPNVSSDNMATSIPTTAISAQFPSKSTKEQNSEAGKILQPFKNDAKLIIEPFNREASYSIIYREFVMLRIWNIDIQLYFILFYFLIPVNGFRFLSVITFPFSV